MRVACVDVGGTAIKSGVLDGITLTQPAQTPTGPPGDGVADRVLARVLAEIARMTESGPLDAAGVVVPGLVDPDNGTAVWSENLGWRDVPMRARLEDALGIPVALGHDVRAGALAEARLGAGSDYRDVVFVPIGTGVAAGIVFDGIVLDRPWATGEIGHVDVGSGERCVCGLTGCLETVSSAAAVQRRYAARTGQQATARQVAERVAAGEPDAQGVWCEAVEGLARAFTWVAAMNAPEAIVLGGGLARSGELLLAPLRAAVESRLSFHHRPVIVASQFGDRAGCVGAGLLAQELVA